MGKSLKKKIFSIVSTTCTMTLLMSTLTTTLANGEVRTDVEVGSVKANIYPAPQNMNYLSSEGMKLEGKVNVVIKGEQEEATVLKLKELLEKNNIDYLISEEVLEGVANIIISSDKSNYKDYGIVDEKEVLGEKEGYILKASNDENVKGNISIVGSDEDGAYYGVLTLGQILEQSTNEGKFAEVNISDYSEIEFRGFIEGFYGAPWTHEERLGLMEDTSKFKMNTYIYAPKDDPYHRKNWKDLYPANEASQIAELAKIGKDNNFNFCWTIHPGATLKFTDADYQALVNKFEQLYSLGVRQFGVLFDDTDDWTNGRKQAEWINKIDTEFVKAKGDVAPMIVISARYNSAWGPNMNVYFKPFMETLHNDIQVMWTGHATMSNVSKEVFEWPKLRTGVNKDLAVWWNYPVNDYCDSRILMAPLHNLNKDLDNVGGFFSNPMNQAEASKVALYSIADYTWNTDEFDYMKSWETSIENLVPEAKEEFMRFASNTSYLKDDGGASGPFEYDESWYLTEKINALKNAIVNKESIIPSAQVLLEEFNTIVSDYEIITSKVTNTNLLEEVNPFLNSYKALGEAGAASMKALIAAEKGEIENWLNNNSVAEENLSLMDTFKVERLKDGVIKEYVVSVGSKRLKALVQESIRDSKSVISKSLIVNYEPKVISSVDGVLNSTVEALEGSYSLKNINNLNLNKGDYIGIALPKAMKLGELKLNADKYEGVTIEYSVNGIEWKDAKATVEDNSLKSNSVIDATFIRVLNSSDKAVTMNIENLLVRPVYKANPKISQNIGTYQNYVIENALDGNLETKYWSDKATGSGHYIQLDLGKNIPVYDINAYFNGQDYMRNSEFKISEDGITWTSLGELKYIDKDGKKLAAVNANGKMARYIRLQANGENSGYWVQLSELQINKSLPEISDDSVSLVESTLKGNFANLYDGDLSTAFEAETVKAGDTLVYKMSRIINIKELLFLQDSNNISNAVISVKDLEGNWTEIGRLDKQFNKVAVNKEILEVKVTFDSANPTPKIYEIIATEAEKFKKHLEIAVAEAKKIEDKDLDKVVPVVAKEFKAALLEAENVLANPNATQKDIDNSFKRLSDVMHMLSFEKGDKGNLTSLVDRIDALNSDEYIKATWDKLAVVLTEAKSVIADENAMKEEVSTTYNKLIKAFLDLRLKPSKDKLQGLIKEVEKLDSSKYTKASFSVLEKELLAAKAVIANENATAEEIASSEKSVYVAIKSLVEVGSNNNGNNNNGNNNGNNGNNNNNGNNGGDNNNNGNNNGNGNNNNGNNNNGSNANNNNSNNNGNKNNNNKLPETGSEVGTLSSILGVILCLSGAILFFKKNQKRVMIKGLLNFKD